MHLVSRARAQLHGLPQRTARKIRLLPSRLRARLGRGGDDDDSFELHRVTRHGAAIEATLRALGERVADATWSLASVAHAPPALVFTDVGGRSLELRLHADERRAYARTRYFSLVYRGRGEFDEPARALLDRVVEAVRGLELRRDAREALRRPALTRVHYYPSLWRAELRPSLVCNHQCGFCNSVDRAGTDNTSQGIDDLLANLELITRLPVLSVAISGGEPTLQRRLPELIERLAACGVSVELQTNGMALAEREYTTRLVRAGLRTALISLHSARPERSDDAITRLPGAWSRTVAGIDEAVRAGLRVELSHVIHRHNADETREYLEFVRRRWGRAALVRLAFVAPTGDARAQAAAFIPRIEEVVPHLVPALAYARRARVRVLMIAYCGIPPCLIQPEHGVSEVARARGDVTFSDDHRKLPACAGCTYERRCPGLWTRYLELHGDPGLRAMT